MAKCCQSSTTFVYAGQDDVEQPGKIVASLTHMHRQKLSVWDVKLSVAHFKPPVKAVAPINTPSNPTHSTGWRHVGYPAPSVLSLYLSCKMA